MKPGTQESTSKSLAFEKIAKAASMLIVPSNALLFDALRETLLDTAEQHFAIDAAQNDTHLKAIAAATLLLLLDAPQPQTNRRYYADVIAGEDAGGAV